MTRSTRRSSGRRYHKTAVPTASPYPAPTRRKQRSRRRCDERASHPDEVGYVEAHGTGTPVGDPVEVRALADALAVRTGRPRDPLLIGSVKTNIGHLEAGRGVAGLIKTALVLKHGYIPANLHLQNPSAADSLGGARALTFHERVAPSPTARDASPGSTPSVSVAPTPTSCSRSPPPRSSADALGPFPAAAV